MKIKIEATVAGVGLLFEYRRDRAARIGAWIMRHSEVFAEALASSNPLPFVERAHELLDLRRDDGWTLSVSRGMNGPHEVFETAHRARPVH